MWWKIDPDEKWKFDLDENLKFGLLEILILYLLTEKDTYGYEIKKDLYIRTNGVFDVKEGSLYGPLYKLEERKLISSNKVLVGKKRFRNYYHIEDSGKEYLEFALEKYQEVSKGVSSLLNWEENNNGNSKK